jgi:hypothetical protein
MVAMTADQKAVGTAVRMVAKTADQWDETTVG